MTDPRSQGAQCWVCPQCHDDKHHVPGDDRCLRQQTKRLTLENREGADLIDALRRENSNLWGWYNDISQERR